MESNINNLLIKKLSKSPYLTRRNLELLLGSKRRTLDYRIFSLIKNGVLIKLKSGFYMSSQYVQEETESERYLEYIGCMLKQPSYVSLRYALSKYNLIPESIFSITYVTTKKTDRFDTAMQSFVYSNITEKFFTGFTQVQYKDKIINFAKPYKAIFDLFYYAKMSSLAEASECVQSSRINWEYVDRSNKLQLKKLLITSNVQKMQRVLQTLQAEKLI